MKYTRLLSCLLIICICFSCDSDSDSESEPEQSPQFVEWELIDQPIPANVIFGFPALTFDMKLKEALSVIKDARIEEPVVDGGTIIWESLFNGVTGRTTVSLSKDNTIIGFYISINAGVDLDEISYFYAVKLSDNYNTPPSMFNDEDSRSMAWPNLNGIFVSLSKVSSSEKMILELTWNKNK